MIAIAFYSAFSHFRGAEIFSFHRYEKVLNDLTLIFYDVSLPEILNANVFVLVIENGFSSIFWISNEILNETWTVSWIFSLLILNGNGYEIGANGNGYEIDALRCVLQTY